MYIILYSAVYTWKRYTGKSAWTALSKSSVYIGKASAAGKEGVSPLIGLPNVPFPFFRCICPVCFARNLGKDCQYQYRAPLTSHRCEVTHTHTHTHNHSTVVAPGPPNLVEYPCHSPTCGYSCAITVSSTWLQPDTLEGIESWLMLCEWREDALTGSCNCPRSRETLQT